MRYFGDCQPENWLFRPLEGMSAVAVLDANVLLDALLIADGIGAFVLAELHRRGFALHTSGIALDEMRRTLDRARSNLPSIAPLVDVMVRNGSFNVHSSTALVPGIKIHDNHIAAAALDLGAFVISEDLPLLYDLDRAKIHGRSLREVALDLVCPQIPRQDLVVFGLGAGADGHVFLKFFADDEIVTNRFRSWFLFDAPDFGSLCYDSNIRSFIFSTEIGDSVSVPIELVSNRQYCLVINYSAGADTRLTIKVRGFGEEIECVTNGRISALEKRPTGSITVLNSRHKNAVWKGALQSVTFGPYQLSSKVWRAAYSLVGVSPPTLTADLTLCAAILTEIVGDRARRPHRDHVLQIANMSIPGFYPGRRVDERETKWFDD